MGIPVRRLSENVRRDAKIDNIKVGTIREMSEALNISVDELLKKLYAYEIEKETFKNKEK